MEFRKCRRAISYILLKSFLETFILQLILLVNDKIKLTFPDNPTGFYTRSHNG